MKFINWSKCAFIVNIVVLCCYVEVVAYSIIPYKNGEIVRASSCFQSSPKSAFDSNDTTSWQASYGGWSYLERRFMVPVNLTGLKIKTNNVSKMSIEVADNMGFDYKEIVLPREITDVETNLSFEFKNAYSIKINLYSSEWPSVSECEISTNETNTELLNKKSAMRRNGNVFAAVLYPEDMHWWSWVAQEDLENALDLLKYSYGTFTDINDIASDINSFDFIILHTRYQTPESDAKRYQLAKIFRDWVENGGVLLSLDADDGTRAEWFSFWGEDFAITFAGSDFPMLSRMKADLKNDAHIFSFPNDILTPMATTTHFTRYNNWQVIASDCYDYPIMLQKKLGKGIVVIGSEDEYESFWQTSADGYSDFIENCIAAGIRQKYGLQIEYLKFPDFPATEQLFECVLSCSNDAAGNYKIMLCNGKDHTIAEKQINISGSKSVRAVLKLANESYVGGNIKFSVAQTDSNDILFRSNKVYNEIPKNSLDICVVEPKYRKELFLSDADLVKVKINSQPENWGQYLLINIFDCNTQRAAAKPSKIKIDKAEIIYELDCQKLKSGEYFVRAWLENAVNVKAEDGFSVLSKQDSLKYVYIDSRDNLVVKGKPIFPLGLYRVPKEKLKNIADIGFNIVAPTNEQGYNTKEYLDEAYDCNLMIVTELNGLLDKVSAFKDHPSVVVWYVSDEPGARKDAAQRTIDDYNQIRKLDPTRPILLVDNMLSQHCMGSDIVAQDLYPSAIIGANKNKILPLELIGTKLRRQQNINESRAKVMWFVPQAFGGWGDYAAAPTPKQIRATAYGTIASGAKGLIWYAYWTPEVADWMIDEKFPDLWQELSKVVGELDRLSPVLLSDEKPSQIQIEPLYPDIPCRFFRYQDCDYLLIVNWQPFKTSKTICLDEAKFSYAKDVLSGKVIYKSGDKFFVMLDPLEVRFIRFY